MKKMAKHSIIGLVAVIGAALLVSTAAVTEAQAQNLKIGVIIPQRLLAEAKIGRQAFEKVKAHKEKAQGQLDTKAADLTRRQEDLKRRLKLLSDDEKRKALEELDETQREAQRLKEDLERDLQRHEGEVLAGVNEFLNKTITDYGKQHGYDLILDASAAMYISAVPDITDDVIRLADSTHK